MATAATVENTNSVTRASAVLDPRKWLVALTLNVGSLALHLSEVNRLLIEEAPHILCMQEARCSDSECRAWRRRLNYLGYTAARLPEHNLVTVWKHFWVRYS